MSRPCCTLGRSRLGLRMIDRLSLSLPPVPLLCGFLSLYLKLITSLSHWWVPTISVWDLLPWLMVGSCSCKLSQNQRFHCIRKQGWQGQSPDSPGIAPAASSWQLPPWHQQMAEPAQWNAVGNKSKQNSQLVGWCFQLTCCMYTKITHSLNHLHALGGT